MKRYIKSYRLFEEEENTSVSVPQPLLDDMEQIKDHCNKIILKPYSVKIEAFTYSAQGDQTITFTGTAFVGKALGVFGSCVQESNITIALTTEDQTARGAVELSWTYKNGGKDAATIGEYALEDGKIMFYGLDEDGDPIEGDPEEIGESAFAVTTSSTDINASPATGGTV